MHRNVTLAVMSWNAVPSRHFGSRAVSGWVIIGQDALNRGDLDARVITNRQAR